MCEFEGNGLGLALCRKIAKRHNGTITANGEKDNGAEFIVTLPLKQAASYL
ncbi:ATP-binding protein [Flavobacterium sp. LBUM151]